MPSGSSWAIDKQLQDSSQDPAHSCSISSALQDGNKEPTAGSTIGDSFLRCMCIKCDPHKMQFYLITKNYLHTSGFFINPCSNTSLLIKHTQNQTFKQFTEK